MSDNYFKLASIKCNENEFEESIPLFNKSLSLNEHWESFLGLGWALYNVQQYQSAVNAFKKSHALKEHWKSNQGLGWSLFNIQQYQPAVDAFNKSLSLKEHWESFLGLGLALCEMGQYQPAVDAFNKSIVLKEHWKSYKGLGLALCEMGQYHPAVDAFNKSLVLKDHWESYLGLAWALFNMQQYQSAVDAFNKSIALNEHWNSYQGLGLALINMQQHQSAVVEFNKSLALKEHWNSWQGLGLALVNIGQYQPAVDAFNKSLALKEHWNAYVGLGLALGKVGQYQSAVDAYSKSLALKEHWNSYTGLGLVLCAIEQYQPAVDAFNKSLSLKEHWHSYQGLGLAFFCMEQNQSAVDAFNKSLALKEHWKSYKGLGLALRNIMQNQSAVDAFNKSLALKEHWSSYQGLGWALFCMEQYQPAVIAFEKSLALRETWKSYQGLGWALDKLGKEREGIQEAQKGYKRFRPPHVHLDPFLGNKGGFVASRNSIESIAEKLSEVVYAFHPSYISGSEENDKLQSWKNLIHIHIPKCAGTNFVSPLALLPHILDQKPNPNKQIKRTNSKHKYYLWHGNLGAKWNHDAFILEAFHGGKMNNLQGSFLANHNGKHGIYCQKLSEAGCYVRKICLVRDPSERLYSHIRHIGRTSYNKNDLLNECIKECSNLMDRYIYDYDLFDGHKEVPYCDPTDYEYCESIDFLEFSDDHLISKVKSSLLSATLMPNIVQYNRLNDNNDKESNRNTMLGKDFKDLHEELILRGCLERDKRIDLEFLKNKTKQRLVFPEIIYNGVELHPITFIYPKYGEPKLMLTKDFFADPHNAINC